MVTATGYAYPWDFAGDPAATDRAHEAGVETVAVAANYHSTRAATPLHPRHRLVDAEHAACYLPIRPAAWQGMRLVPRVPGWTVPTPSPWPGRLSSRRDYGSPRGPSSPTTACWA
ncbi:hypothetical protein WKI68_43585 [Streptomyces sp. MS1.HAVA.3]|uniref:Uncharacterized protein n=1 Tax=Streptomyces caledonius TaxID=3134107 RepID=A0ABU8UEE4_9ACTN